MIASVALVFQHAKRMRRIALSLKPVWLYHTFSCSLWNGTIFGKWFLKIKCEFWFSLQLLPETFLILRRIQRDTIINVHRYSRTRYSCRIWTKLEFSRHFRKNTQISDFKKILPVGAELSHADGQTDMTKLIVIFRNFGNAPSKYWQ